MAPSANGRRVRSPGATIEAPRSKGGHIQCRVEYLRFLRGHRLCGVLRDVPLCHRVRGQFRRAEVDGFAGRRTWQTALLIDAALLALFALHTASWRARRSSAS